MRGCNGLSQRLFLVVHVVPVRLRWLRSRGVLMVSHFMCTGNGGNWTLSLLMRWGGWTVLTFRENTLGRSEDARGSTLSPRPALTRTPVKPAVPLDSSSTGQIGRAHV